MILYPATYGHNGYAFNAHLNADGSPKLTELQATTIIDEVVLDPSYRDLRAPYHLAQGGSLGRIHKGIAYLTISGRIEVADATQLASVSDAERALRAAFDPYLCYLDSPSTEGAYAFTFNKPTTDTTNYPQGRMGCRYYARPASAPSTRENRENRASLPFSLALVLPDPRMYESVEKSTTLNSGNSFSANLVTLGTVPAPLQVTISMSGAGASNFTLSDGTTSFTMNLSGVGAGTIIVNMETSGPYGQGRTITDDGTPAFSLKTSAPGTWLSKPVGTTTYTATNTTGVTSVILKTHAAWA